MPRDLSELPDDLLARVLAFAAPRDLEAATVASKAVAHHVLPRFPLWKTLFCYRWAMLNFSLDDGAPAQQGHEKVAAVEIDSRLRALFPSSCTESRMFQLLAHAVTPVPSYADVDATMRYRRNTWMDHTIVSLGSDNADARSSKRRLKARPLDFAFAGRYLGGDRSVRANAPFSTTFHVQVLGVRTANGERKFQVGVTASGYFEITIARREQPHPAQRVSGSDMSAIGVGSHRFRLIGKQPGWDSDSFGYHGDDGHFFNHAGHGREFGPSFDVGDTVGCGVRRNMRDLRSSIFFTHSGDLIPTGDRGIECEHDEWYPVVGLDSANAIHVNYGQEPFRYDEIVDELFDECRGMTSILANQLQWYDISESDVESSSDDDMSDTSSQFHEQDDDLDDEFNDDVHDDAIADARERFLHRMFFGVGEEGFSDLSDDDESLLEFENDDENDENEEQGNEVHDEGVERVESNGDGDDSNNHADDDSNNHADVDEK